MVENDFLVWAPSGGNVMSQANYAASTSLTNGVTTGIADPTLANKTWRQASIMAAVIAQFIQQQLPSQTVVDDGTTATILSSLTKALQNLTMPSGQCVLALATSTSIKLSPYNGNLIPINGIVYEIPSSGVTAANTTVLVNGASGNLAASTTYYVSVYNNAGTLTLAYWSQASYSHMPDTTAGNVGVEVISSGGVPNSAHTLVGILYTDTGANFVDSTTERWVRSWFNRKSVELKSTTQSGIATSSTTPVELQTNLRLSAVFWADESMWAIGTGYANNNTAGSSANMEISLDGTSYIGPLSQATSAGAGQNNDISAVGTAFTPGEGGHYITLFGYSSTAATVAAFTVATFARISH